MTVDLSERAKGTLLGLACGDALGRPVELRSPEQSVHDVDGDIIVVGTTNGCSNLSAVNLYFLYPTLAVVVATTLEGLFGAK